MKKIYIIALFSIINVIANAQYTKLFDFADSTGGGPKGSLIYDGNYFYGMTYYMGVNNLGTVFKIKPDGTGYTKLLDFNGAINGSYPYGSLVSDSTFLYGMTSYGGVNDMGVIFKIKPNGSGYTKLWEFGGYDGKYPEGSLIYDGTYLYGMTQGGGANFDGAMFKIKTDGSGYTKLLDFSASSGNAPRGSVISDGTFLYGMTISGGTYGHGTIIKIMLNGTGYTKILDFDSTNGSRPVGSLIYNNTFLYGMTSMGGAHDLGTAFKIRTNGSGYFKLLDFDGSTNGKNPNGDFIFDGTFLYGMTQEGGLYNSGRIFKIMYNGTNYTNLVDLGTATNSSYPTGSLIFAGTFLYGMTNNGGAHLYGTIFELSPLASISEVSSKETIDIYPNPNNGIFTLETNSNLSQTVQLFDVNGRVVLTQTVTEKSQIDASKLPNGIYNLSITDRNFVTNRRIVISK
jgi:uncharacterized repeat protein (TIGR03803 family)